jgi:hypothetical protein
MQVNTISGPNFGVRIVNSVQLKKFNSCATKENSQLMTKIIDALGHHPSQVILYPFVENTSKDFYEVQGGIENGVIRLIDTKAEKSSSPAPIQNIFRRILDPANKNKFNELTGEKYAQEYDSWWNEYVMPLWQDIEHNFRG